jgi:hypothetical protein
VNQSYNIKAYFLNFVQFNVFPEENVTAGFRKSKFERARYGPLVKLVTYLVIILPATGIPIASMYLKIDPTYHIIKHLFQVLPIFTHILRSIFGILTGLLVPLGILLCRYFSILPVFYEGFRSLALVLMMIVLSAGQFQDAFDFQTEFFRTLKRNPVSQIRLQHVLKYREILIIRNTFGTAMKFGLLATLACVMSTIIWVNYNIINSYHLIPPAVTFMLVCFVSVEIASLSVAMEGASVVNEASVELLKRFRRGTIHNMQSGRRKYLLRMVRSLQVFSFSVGIPGFDFFSFSRPTKKHIVQFIMDNTINALLTF